MGKKVKGLFGGAKKPKNNNPPAPTSTQPTNVQTQDAASLQAAMDEQKKRQMKTVLQDATGGPADQLG